MLPHLPSPPGEWFKERFTGPFRPVLKPKFLVLDIEILRLSWMTPLSQVQFKVEVTSASYFSDGKYNRRPLQIFHHSNLKLIQTSNNSTRISIEMGIQGLPNAYKQPSLTHSSKHNNKSTEGDTANKP